MTRCQFRTAIVTAIALSCVTFAVPPAFADEPMADADAKPAADKPKPKRGKTDVYPVVLNGHSYKIYRRVMGFDEAKRFCEEKGGHLVTIESYEEAAFVSRLARDHNVWLGASDSEKEGDWRWINGEKMTHTDWYPGEPNDLGGEDFVIVQGSFRKDTNRWVDKAATFQAPVLCEWDHLPEQDTQHPDRKNRVAFGGHTYQYFDEAMNWTVAKAFCEGIGGHLVIIDNAQEHSFVRNRLADNANIWLGASDFEGEGHWKGGTARSSTFAIGASASRTTQTGTNITSSQPPTRAAGRIAVGTMYRTRPSTRSSVNGISR